MSNLLITSSGSKVLLVKAFQKACAGTGKKVYSADQAASCASAFFSDGHVTLPPCSPGQEEFLSSLMRQCLDREITVVIPTRDGELATLAAAHDRFLQEGISIVISPSEAISICQDKIAFGQFLQRRNMPILPHLIPGSADFEFPLFLRPRRGARGHGVKIVRNENELRHAGDLENYVINRLVDKTRAREFTIDTLMSLKGEPLQAVVRSRDSVVDGESVISTVVEDSELEAESLRLGAALGLRGHVTIQAFRLEDGSISFIEVNARFGGASNLSIVAGLDSPARILAMIDENPAAYSIRRISSGTRMYRFKTDVFEFPDVSSD